MSERRAEINGGSRRDFLRSSGLAAGGAALIGADLPAATQTPISDRGPGESRRSIVPRVNTGAGGRGARPVVRNTRFVRLRPAETHLRHLGPLHQSWGTWVGSGFSA